MAGSAALHAHHVSCLEALGAFQQVKLHGFAFVQCAISVLLNCGEMYEDVLARRTLNEAISFSPVEPLHCTLLSHKNSFRLCVVGVLSRAHKRRLLCLSFPEA